MFSPQGAADRLRQPRQPIFKDVIRGSLLDALDGGHVPQRPRYHDHGNVDTLGVQDLEHFDTSPLPQVVIGQDDVGGFFLDPPLELAGSLYHSGGDVKTSLAQFAQHQLGIGWVVFHQQYLQLGFGLGRAL